MASSTSGNRPPILPSKRGGYLKRMADVQDRKGPEYLADRYRAAVELMRVKPNASVREISEAIGVGADKISNWRRFGLPSLGLPPLRNRPEMDPPPPTGTVSMAAGLDAGRDYIEAVIQGTKQRIVTITSLVVDGKTLRQVECAAGAALAMAGAENAIAMVELSSLRRDCLRDAYQKIAADTKLDPAKRASALAALDTIARGLESSARGALDFDRVAHGKPTQIVQLNGPDKPQVVLVAELEQMLTRARTLGTVPDAMQVPVLAALLDRPGAEVAEAAEVPQGVAHDGGAA